MEILGILSIGTILGIVIKHFLDRSTVISERNYQFQKEELFRYRKLAENVISKLLLLEGHRELFLIYLQLSYDATREKDSVFIDLNNTLDKSGFEKNKEEIATIIFLYFSEISDNWNICLDTISSMATIVNQIELKNKSGITISWQKDIENFNILNQNLGDQPHELATKLKEIISQKEKYILSQKPKFLFF